MDNEFFEPQLKFAEPDPGFVPDLTPPKPKKPSLFKRLFRPKVIVPTVLAASVATGGVLYVRANTDQAVATAALRDLRDKVEDVAVVDILSQCAEGGRVSYRIGKGDLTPVDVGYTLWADVDDMEGAIELFLGDESVCIQASTEEMAIQGSVVGEPIGLAYEDLTQLIFGQYPGISTDELGELAGILVSGMMEEAGLPALDDIEGLIDGLSDISEHYADFFADAFFAYGTVTSERVDGNRVITVRFDQNSAANLVPAFGEELAKDEDLIDLLEEYIPMSQFTGGMPMMSWSSIFSQRYIWTSLAQEVRQSEFCITMKVTATSFMHDFLKLELSVNADGEQLDFLVDCSDDDRMRIVAGENGTYLLETVWTQDGDNWHIECNAEGKTYASVDWKYDGKQNFELVAQAEGESVRIVGTYVVSENAFTVSIETVEYNGEVMHVNLTIDADATEKVPQMPNYKKFTEMTDSDAERILQNYQRFAERLEATLGQYFDPPAIGIIGGAEADYTDF